MNPVDSDETLTEFEHPKLEPWGKHATDQFSDLICYPSALPLHISPSPCETGREAATTPFDKGR